MHKLTLLENTRVVTGELGRGACAQGNQRAVEEWWGPKTHLGPRCGSPLLKQGALVEGESESLILLPNSTENDDGGNAKAERILVIVTGSSLSWLWGCFVGFFKVL